jgi:alkyl hydroperoxide reductase subunit AhpC
MKGGVMAEQPQGCARVTGTVVGDKTPAIQPVDIPSENKEMKMTARVGQKAPDFTAPAYFKGGFTTIKLSDYAGKWVLVCFYPGDFTFVWATEVSAVADKYGELQKLGVEVISVSVDSHFVHKMWNDNELSKMVEGGVPFHMASDQAGNVGKAYGVYDENQGIELRGRFIIDPDGVIQAMEVLTPPVGRRFGETVRQIQAFQLVRESKGKEATPAGWMPGDLTLRPGPDLVGNVWKVWKPSMEG